MKAPFEAIAGRLTDKLEARPLNICPAAIPESQKIAGGTLNSVPFILLKLCGTPSQCVIDGVTPTMLDDLLGTGTTQSLYTSVARVRQYVDCHLQPRTCNKGLFADMQAVEDGA